MLMCELGDATNIPRTYTLTY